MICAYGETSSGTHKIKISFDVFKTMSSESQKNSDSETGGILIGNYDTTNSIVSVSIATPPPSDSQAGRYWFKRGVFGLKKALLSLWNNPRKTYYVGEWHYHPSKIVNPSYEDSAQMYEISTTEQFKCPQPVMIIIGKANHQNTVNFRAFVYTLSKLEEFHIID